jgi:serine/threonine protein kinase
MVVLCHQYGIILRDLRSRKFIFADAEMTQLRIENVDEFVVLQDYNMDTLTERCGCPTYVSPEVLAPRTREFALTFHGKPADVWQLGVLLYVMIIGLYPFNDHVTSKLFDKIRNEPLRIPNQSQSGNHLNKSITLLIRGILRKDPSERPSAMEILAHPYLCNLSRKPNSNVGIVYPSTSANRHNN